MAVTLGSTGITFPDATTQTTAATAGSMTLLGTITTTSGATQTLSGLTLTSYKEIYCVLKAVSITANANIYLTDPSTNTLAISATALSSNFSEGTITINLTNGVFTCVMFASTLSTPSFNTTASSVGYGGITTFSTSSTSVGFQAGAGTFDFGSILVYGVK